MLIYSSRGNSSTGKDVLTLEKGFICPIQFGNDFAAVAYEAYEKKKINVQIIGFHNSQLC